MVTFLNLPIPCKVILEHSGTPTETTTQFKEEKRGPKFFRLKVIFPSGLIGKFHINFTVDNVFEIIVSRKKVQWSFQWFILFTPNVNHLVSIKKGHKKASRAFLLMIYNVIIDFLFCKWDFSVSAFTLNH